MKGQAITDGKDHYLNRDAVEYIIDDTFKNVKKNITKESNEKYKDDAKMREGVKITLDLVKAYNNSLKQNVEHHYDRAAFETFKACSDTAPYPVQKTHWWQDTSSLPWQFILWMLAFIIGICVGVLGCCDEMQTYYEYTDVDGNTGYASRCYDGKCYSGNKTILVDSYKSITEE